MAACVLQGLKVPQQYPNMVGIFAYDANNGMLEWKRKNEAGLELALCKTTHFFLLRSLAFLLF